MKNIFKQYIDTILTALALVIVLSLIFVKVQDQNGNTGILNIIGANIPTYTEHYENYSDFPVFETEAAKPSPVFDYVTQNQMYTMENLVANYIEAKGYEGNKLNIKILKISDADGNDCSDLYNPDTGMIVFSLPGTYVIRAQAVDDINKKTVVDIKVPVQKV